MSDAADNNNQNQDGGDGKSSSTPSQSQPAAFTPDIHANAAKAYFESQGYVIKLKDEIDREKQAEIDAAVRNAHVDWENALAGTLGVQKPNGVKGIEWAKKSLQERLSGDNSGDKASTEKDAVIESLREQLENFKKEVEDEKKRVAEVKARTEFEGALKVMKFSDDKEENLVAMQDAADMLRGRYTFKFSDEYGRTLAYGKDGKPIVDTNTAAPITLDALVARDTGRYVKKTSAPKPAGTGMTPPAAKNKDGIPIFSKKDDIFEEANSKYSRGSREWFDYVKKITEASGIDLDSLI